MGGVSLHSERHPTYVDGCWQCRIASVQVGGFPSPPSLTERRWDRDMAAYKALRKDGLQPPAIDGATKLQDAGSQFEVEWGKTFDKQEQAKVKEGLKMAEDLGISGA